MLTGQTKIQYLVGDGHIRTAPSIPYEEKTCDFLQALSKALREDREAKQYSDIQTFAFWIRKSNIQKLKEQYLKSQRMSRLGKGLVFHIAPSNVPINFAYTLVFGLLAGNSNIVKVSSKQFIQTTIICRVIKELTENPDFLWVQQQNAVVMYDRDNRECTDFFSGQCDVRVIWGGNQTIEEIRKSPIPARSTDVTFADRYSFGVISAEAVCEASDQEISKLARDFYNDTYLMDQNACSTPHMIFWTGNENCVKAAQRRFWTAIYEASKKYDLADLKVSDKYTLLCKFAVEMQAEFLHFENRLYVLNIDEINDSILKYRGKYGLFFQHYVKKPEEIFSYVNDRTVQTCAVYGIDKTELLKKLIDSNLMGIDRIVSFGQTLDIGTVWDGYDVIDGLSRCIFV